MDPGLPQKQGAVQYSIGGANDLFCLIFSKSQEMKKKEILVRLRVCVGQISNKCDPEFQWL